MAKTKFDITQHVLVPKHEKMTKKDIDSLLKDYNITLAQLPEISVKDPAVQLLKVEIGDVVRITRNSPTAGNIYFYRCVVE